MIRPADANEVAFAWKVAITRRTGPTVLVLTRHKIPVLDRSKYNPASGVEKGAYVLIDLGKGDPDIILMASGSEVSLIVQAAEKLHAEGVKVRVVSFPSWRLFEAQDQEYKDTVLLPNVTKRLAVEAGISQGWRQWLGAQGSMI